jgi:hypothetical protein
MVQRVWPIPLANFVPFVKSAVTAGFSLVLRLFIVTSGAQEPDAWANMTTGCAELETRKTRNHLIHRFAFGSP